MVNDNSGLFLHRAAGKREPVTLEQVDVQAKVVDFAAEVSVTQTYVARAPGLSEAVRDDEGQNNTP